MAMISPWMDNGNLLGYLKLNPTVQRSKLLIEISSGVAYLHELGAGNVLISREGVAKLADFGCTRLKKNTLHFTTTTDSPGFSTRWAAPEILSGDQMRSKEADIYALGMTLLEAVTGHPPFHKKHDLAVLRIVCIDKETPERPIVFASFSSTQADLLWEILSDSWSFVSTSRPDAKSIWSRLKEVERCERGRPSHIEESSAQAISPRIEEIIKCLIDHGIQDVTNDLDLDSASHEPVAWGERGSVYFAKLQDGTEVAVKCLSNLSALARSGAGSKVLKVCNFADAG
ncbi:hypothetical protein FRC12_001782 [Ceratobasidium sp. 428]|nr:hypothetical protein FRC12_001782 [Ceratobasidium sp. 428]